MLSGSNGDDDGGSGDDGGVGILSLHIYLPIFFILSSFTHTHTISTHQFAHSPKLHLSDDFSIAYK